MSTLVILGSGGRLGAALARGYAAETRVIGLNHSQLDLASPEAIRCALGGLDFDALINAAALTNVDYCETHEEEAFAVNARAVREIAEICARKRARCIHISTDYVFDGMKREPYTESDAARPLSVYGASKRQGEIELLDACADHLAARVSWVFGPDRPSFVDQILKRALETDELQAIGDKWSTPTYTLDLVDWLRPLLWEKPVGGVLHLTPSGACTWQEYGQYALDCAAQAGRPLKGRTVAFQALRDLKAFVAERPIYTVLDTQRLTTVTGIVPRPWQEAVAEYVRTMQ
ncbi:MAG: dTDP-4-dehydrorhamnose reductase [Verrucomicrobia bacterium]|nr:dTDP-4-dehydrorhamnose reductase [Verrucomicrobiota bacterium]